MENLLQNRLFLQYLSGAGGALSSGQPVGATLDAITQQNIAAQSKAKLNERYMKIMKQMMGGEIPTKGKMTMDETGLKFDVPKSALATIKDDDTVEGIAGGLRAEAPEPGPMFGQMSTDRSNFLNPSASPLDDISGADLAGLTAADVSQALSGAVGVQALKQKTLTDIADIAYRKGALEDMRKRTEIYGRPAIAKREPLDEPFIGGLSLRQFKALTPRAKDYTMAKEISRKLGDPEFMTQDEWDALKPTDREKFLRAAMDDPKLMEAAKELGRSEQQPLRRPLVTWTTAMNQLSARFGRQDPTGMWAITPELQAAHDEAQKYLDEYRIQGMEPMTAINKANERARVWISDIENRYHEYIEAAQRIKNKDQRRETIERVRVAYLDKFGYIPSVRR